MSDYENNSVKRRRVECGRISGLLDWILEAAMMLGDGEAGGVTTLMSTKAVDRHRQTATSHEDDRQKLTAGPLLALTLRERASDLRRGRDVTFRRRVDGPLVKNRARGDGRRGEEGRGR